jgi:hypothetical protein
MNRYSQAMKDSKRATVYFDPDVHRALSRKAAQSFQSVSHVVNEAVRIALAEDAEDLKAFRERASEKNLDFANVVKSLKAARKIIGFRSKNPPQKNSNRLGPGKIAKGIATRIAALASNPRPTGSENSLARKTSIGFGKASRLLSG